MHRWFVFLLPAIFASGLQAQSGALTCADTAVPAIVRAEGIAERTGDILLSCSGGPTTGQVSGNVIVSLNVNVTNRLSSDGTTDVFLTVNNGTSTVTYTARPFSINAVRFDGVVFSPSPQGTAEVRIVNLRGNISQLGFNASNNTVTATVSFTGAGLAVPSSTFMVAVPQRGLLATTTGRLICDQTGSPLPATLDFAHLVTTSAFSATRVTEGFASAFAPLGDPSNFHADSGVRIIARYSGFTSGARLFVPDVIAGSDADVPTAGGDLGFAASPGQYTPGKGELLLVRVNGADSNGAGGTLALSGVSGTTTFGSVSEVTLTGGAALVVYEVVDANPSVIESAQFPTFLGLVPNSGASGTPTNFSVNLAPVSNVFTQSASAPIPRFIDSPPPTDCSALADCTAGYFPQIVLDATPIQLTAAAGQAATKYIPIRNGGAGVLQWTATVAYVSGSNWLRFSNGQSGVNNGTLRVDAVTTGLAPVTYQAIITIDAGAMIAKQSLPVTLTVTGAVPTAVVGPSISSVSNAAGAGQTSLVAGSLATVMGTQFTGNAVQVTFDGSPATVLYSNGTQINLQVPAAVAGKKSSSMVVSVDGYASAPAMVSLAGSAPAIFPGAVLNQDYVVNGAGAPATTGSVLQVFATGLPASGVITAKIHDRLVPVPQYGGAAPGLPGVQQVNILVPADLPTMQTYVFVCGGASADQQVCSAPAKVWITQ